MTPRSSPERFSYDPLRALYNRALQLVLQHGMVDQHAAYAGEHYPRYNHNGEESHRFEVSYALSPGATDQPSRVNLKYDEAYIDEAGEFCPEGELLATLYYDEGYSKDIWLQLQPHGDIKTAVRMNLESPVETLASHSLPSNEDQTAFFEALRDEDEQRLMTLLREQSQLNDWIESVMFVMAPHTFTEIGMDELEELGYALRQLEEVL